MVRGKEGATGSRGRQTATPLARVRRTLCQCLEGMVVPETGDNERETEGDYREGDVITLPQDDLDLLMKVSLQPFLRPSARNVTEKLVDEKGLRHNLPH